MLNCDNSDTCKLQPPSLYFYSRRQKSFRLLTLVVIMYKYLAKKHLNFFTHHPSSLHTRTQCLVSRSCLSVLLSRFDFIDIGGRGDNICIPILLKSDTICTLYRLDKNLNVRSVHQYMRISSIAIAYLIGYKSFKLFFVCIIIL